MKKFLLAMVLVFSLATPSFAAWTIDVSVEDVKGHYVIYQIDCTSDGTALSATDIVALMTTAEYDYVKRGATAMVMNTVPGTGGAAPTTTINVTFSDIATQAVFAATGISNVADTVGTDLSGTLNQYPVITTKWYLTLNDIGDAADSVTFYLYCWVE